MLVPNNSPSIARTIITGTTRTIGILVVPVLGLALGACSRPEIAPDCSKIQNDACVIPGGEVATIECDPLPVGAVGATYEHVQASNESGEFGQWTASELPAGLSIDPATGTISGIPTEPSAIADILITTRNTNTNEMFSATCGELVINPSLDANLVAMEPNHCIDASASYEDMLALLDNGDGTEITCSPLTPSDGTSCPLGNGNGRMAPGISFDASSCTHSGSVAGDRRGTWVWMVEVSQSGYTTRVPFCASNDVDTFHDITVTALSNQQSDLVPGILEYDPAESISFGSGEYHWQIEDPACPGPDCNSYGFRFEVSCSPFDLDAPWMITLSPSAQIETGLTHEMTASGPAPDPKFDGRPWVASFDISYCTSSDGTFCDTDNSDQFTQNAQTQYHFDVIGFPTKGP